MQHLKAYAVHQLENPKFEPEEDGIMWGVLGTFVNFFGWYFFNGGSSYTLYQLSLDPAKIITNTLLCGLCCWVHSLLCEETDHTILL